MWLEYYDENGPGFAQPDLFLLGKGGLIVIECKLTYNTRAWDQLYGLYAPLLSRLYSLPVRSIQACRYLKVGCPPAVLVPELTEAVPCGGTWHLWNV